MAKKKVRSKVKTRRVIKKNKSLSIVVLSAICALVILFALAINQVVTVQKAHSTFSNYYEFRGCTQLLTKTNSSATCKLSDGKVIKLVLFNGRWYLDGDLPTCWGNFCF